MYKKLREPHRIPWQGTDKDDIRTLWLGATRTVAKQPQFQDRQLDCPQIGGNPVKVVFYDQPWDGPSPVIDTGIIPIQYRTEVRVGIGFLVNCP